jgi:exonuclease III
VDRTSASRLTACRIDREPRKLQQPSDHAPVVAELT